jgi:hypothetical protein
LKAVTSTPTGGRFNRPIDLRTLLMVKPRPIRPATARAASGSRSTPSPSGSITGRRYTARTNQAQRSFEDTAVKQKAVT